MTVFWEMWQYPFLQRALFVGLLVSLCAAILSVVCFTVGLILSYVLGVPSGASVVLTDAAAFLLFSLLRAVRSRRRG